MQPQRRQPAGLRLPGPTPARRDDFQEADNLRSPSMSTASYEQSPRTPAVAFRPGAVMPSQSAGKEGLHMPEEYYYLPYAPSDYQQPAGPSSAYDPYFHQTQHAVPVRAYAPPPQNYGYEPGQYYAPANPAAYAPTQEYYYDYAPQRAPANYYSPTGVQQYTQHPRGNEAQYPYNASIAYGQPVPTRQSQQASPHRAPPNALQQPVEPNALQLEMPASSRPARPIQPSTQIPRADAANSPGASETSEPDGEFEYVFDCPDCGTSFLSLRALHAHLFIQYRRGWCPGVP